MVWPSPSGHDTPRSTPHESDPPLHVDEYEPDAFVALPQS
jgi:hypothetical protein